MSRSSDLLLVLETQEDEQQLFSALLGRMLRRSRFASSADVLQWMTTVISAGDTSDPAWTAYARLSKRDRRMVALQLFSRYRRAQTESDLDRGPQDIELLQLYDLFDELLNVLRRAMVMRRGSFMLHIRRRLTELSSSYINIPSYVDQELSREYIQDIGSLLDDVIVTVREKIDADPRPTSIDDLDHITGLMQQVQNAYGVSSNAVQFNNRLHMIRGSWDFDMISGVSSVEILTLIKTLFTNILTRLRR